MSIAQQFRQSCDSPERWRHATALMPAELTSIGLVLWAASRLFFNAKLTSSALVGAFVAWPLLVFGLTALVRGPGRHLGISMRVLTYGVGPMVIVTITNAGAGGLSGAQAWAIGIVLTLYLAASRWLLALSTGNRAPDLADGLRWALLQGIAVYAIHPYVRCALVGLGDARHYANSLADFVGQIRAGIFPVFIGQTQFAFNGGIHTVRTAPYLTHLGWFLDLLTLHTLPPYALGNLAILFSAIAGTLGCYLAMLLYAPKRQWLALAMSALYILSPAILTPLFENDMIPTFMAVPMIPWLALGLALATDNPNTLKPWLLQSVAVAGLWWAHPPTAVWATVLCAGVLLAAILRRRIARAGIAYLTLAALLFAVLAVYEFVSVLTLKLPPGPSTQADEAAAILGSVRSSWPASFEPVSAGGDRPLRDIQLGYSILACLLAGMLVPRRRGSATVLLGCILCILAFLIPVPVATNWLWAHVPKAMLDVTNNWPMQRLYPILTCLAVFSSFAGLSALRIEHPRRMAALATALVAAVAWSAIEAQKIFAGAARDTSSHEESELLFKPDNIVLTRVAYMFFGVSPGYFSNSHMEPFMETRLLDARTLTMIADGASRLSGAKAVDAYTRDFREAGNDAAQVEIRMGPRESDIFRFDFMGREPRGELELKGHTLRRLYTLPSSGSEKAFGAGPQNGQTIAVKNYDDEPDLVAMKFVPDPISSDRRSTSKPFARVTIEPLEDRGRVVELRSLLPFRAIVHADRKAILETPRVDVPGYRATVNGLEVAIVHTGEGLVGVPLPAGVSEVRLDYPGPAVLRLAYGTSVAGWLALGACLAGLSLVDCSSGVRRRMSVLEASISRLIVPALVAAAIGVAVAVMGQCLWKWVTAPKSGSLRLTVRLPAENAGQTEPLLTSGRPGMGDVIYLKFLGGNRVSVGYDHWGLGGDISAPIDVDFALPQTIEISMRSLVRRPVWGARSPDVEPRGVRVSWNGRQIISTAIDSYPPGVVEVGANSIGASSCGPRFNGSVLDIRPVD